MGICVSRRQRSFLVFESYGLITLLQDAFQPKHGAYVTVSLSSRAFDPFISQTITEEMQVVEACSL